MQSRGVFDADGTLTANGRDVREEVERTTDAQMAAPIAAHRRRRSASCSRLLEPWGAAIRAQRGYLTSGANDLADAGARR